MKVVKLCKTHKKASLSSCLLWLRRELAPSPKQHSTINHDLPKIFYSGSKANMKTHRFYWSVRSVAQPSSVLAAEATITWGPILNRRMGSKLQPRGSRVPRRLTKGTLRTSNNAQRRLHERAMQPAPLRHRLQSWIPLGGGDDREAPAQSGEHWQGRPGRAQLERGQGRGLLGKFRCKTLASLRRACWKWDFSKDFYPTKLRVFLPVFFKNRNSKRHICDNSKLQL